MTAATDLYRAEQAKRVGRENGAMAAAQEEMARVDAAKAERRKLMTVRCACGKSFDYLRGMGRPPTKCSTCRGKAKPKVTAVARITPAAPIVAEVANGNGAGPRITPRQFTLALRARLAVLHHERECVEALLRLHEEGD